MQHYPKGATVHYRITYLDMAQRPSWGWPSLPHGRDLALLKADKPPAWYFLSLYDAVGRDYAWTDKFEIPQAEIDETMGSADVALYTLIGHGWPQGFFMLDWREPGTCDLAYFGLVPQAVGKGLGTWLLKTAILTGWERPGTKRMTVNTCTLDHPRALAQYQRMGFSPTHTEETSRTLVRDQTFLQPLL